jgi:hypothetical protein
VLANVAPRLGMDRLFRLIRSSFAHDLATTFCPIVLRYPLPGLTGRQSRQPILATVRKARGISVNKTAPLAQDSNRLHLA